MQDTDMLTTADRKRLERRKTVLEMHQSGATVREIADKLGVSTQWIYELLDKLRAEGHIEEAS